MTERQPRYNEYAEPLPLVADARQASMLDKSGNREVIDRLATALMRIWPSVLRRGWYGRVSVELDVVDGVIQGQQQVSIIVTERHRL